MNTPLTFPPGSFVCIIPTCSGSIFGREDTFFIFEKETLAIVLSSNVKVNGWELPTVLILCATKKYGELFIEISPNSLRYLC